MQILNYIQLSIQGVIKPKNVCTSRYIKYFSFYEEKPGRHRSGTLVENNGNIIVAQRFFSFEMEIVRFFKMIGSTTVES